MASTSSKVVLSWPLRAWLNAISTGGQEERDARAHKWLSSIAQALAALLWDIVVAISLVRNLRGRRSIPCLLHATLAAIIALAASVCLVILVVQLVRDRSMPRKAGATLACLMTAVV